MESICSYKVDLFLFPMVDWPMEKSKPIHRYLSKQAMTIPEMESLDPPADGLRLCVVIPCLAERSGIAEVIDSLEKGSQRLSQVEVIVVVNNPADPGPAVLRDNLDTLDDLRCRAPGNRIALRLVDRASAGCWLPKKKAGVGLARRIGMDLALHRLVESGRADRSAIACLDGDSPVSLGYVDKLLEVFDSPDPPLGGVCRCHHPLPEEPGPAAAIVIYETWMRYFELGLRLSGSPFSFPTIGSCLVVSALGYALADGMAPRAAGEDFHFFQKIIKLCGTDRPYQIPTWVHPSPRLSDRVPFGTGRAMLHCQREGVKRYLYVEPPETFLDLKIFFDALNPGFFQPEILREAASHRLKDFLDSERAWPILESIRQNQPDADHFGLAVHHWFDGLRCVRYSHHCLREIGSKWLYSALVGVLSELGLPPCSDDPEALDSEGFDLHQKCLVLKKLREITID
jgi:glycosyltransferase involved in cell wall biosynthesis